MTSDLPPWLLGNAYQRAINMAAALRINGMPRSSAGNLCCIVHECFSWGTYSVSGVWTCDAHAAQVQAAIDDMVARANAGAAPVVLELAQRIRVATPVPEPAPPPEAAGATPSPPEVCRCGWNGQGDHPCHGGSYTCKKPAKRRTLDVSPPYVTWACDECWAPGPGGGTWRR